MAGPRPTREQCLDEAAQILADARYRRDSLTPRAAAVEAGATTEAEIEALAARIAADREAARERHPA